MKIICSGISKIFDTDSDYINSIIIENPNLLRELCEDVYNQIQGVDGKTVVSIDDKPVDISKNVEILTQFVPFELNKKSLLNKLVAKIDNLAKDPEYYEYTISELANLENYLWKLTENVGGNVVFPKLTINSIVKAVGIEFDDDYKSLGEKIIDYMDLVREYDKDKLFMIVNLRSFISDEECSKMYDTMLRKRFHIIMIDNCEKTLCFNEKRVIVDSDCCEIG